ncbi:MAG TPA: AAA-like domain-containing protein [Blastocatellia bacterium]|nr:AAA-like domain-containing protein [Blastocatellia bacterium]
MSAVQAAITSEFYVVGGTMRPDAPSYVERQADKDLLDGLLRGEFCYVLTSRQMGKSSLMIRAAGKLRKQGIGVAVLDLSAIGQNLSVEQWYSGLMLQLGLRLNLEDELIEFWQLHPELGPLQRWLSAIRTVVLPKYPDRLVIFVDEIDVVLSLPFSTDEFFAGIRECYNLRSEEPELERLTFCLLGVATPADLIRNTRMTPFNIGRRIELRDFAESEAAPLSQGLSQNGREGQSLLKRILYWSGGHPFLTQRLCRAAAEDPLIKEPSAIDKLCDELFFTRRARERDDNLLFVRERILRSEADVAGLLYAYRKVRRGWRMPDDESNPLVSILRLSGIVRAESGKLKIRNRIYGRVFDLDWVTSNLPDAEVRRQRAAFRRGALGIAALSAVILAVVGWLAIRASNEAEARRRLLYLRQIGVAWQEFESNSNVARVNELLEGTRPEPGKEDLRSLEWYQLWHLTHLVFKQIQTKNPVVSVSFSPDGRNLLMAERQRNSANGTSQFLVTTFEIPADNSSLRELSTFSLPAGKHYNAIAFSPDSRRVAADTPDGKIIVRDIRTNQDIYSFKPTDNDVARVLFSPDSKRLVVTDMGGNVALFDMLEAPQLLWIKKVSGPGPWPTFSADSSKVVCTNESSVVHVWDVITGKESILNSGGATISRALFFPDGKRLLCSLPDGTLQVRDSVSQQLLAVLKGHTGVNQALRFSPDGTILATGNYDRTVRLWSAEGDDDNEITTIKGHGSAVNSLAWSADGKYLASGSADGSLKIWGIESLVAPELARKSVKRFRASVFMDGNKPVVFGVTKANEMKLWSLDSGQPLVTFEAGDHSLDSSEVLTGVFSFDGKMLATSFGDPAHRGPIKLWDTTSGRLIKTLTRHSDYVYNMAFSPDGKQLISGDVGNTEYLWNVTTGQPSELPKQQSNYSFRATFSPGGNLLAVALTNGAVSLIDVASRKLLRVFEGHTQVVKAIAFSADGKMLATGGDDNMLRLWDVNSGRMIRKVGQSDSLNRLIFSPDGKRLISGGKAGMVKLWDVASAQEIFTFKGHAGDVTSLTIGPDGKTLITTSDEGTVRFWRAANDKSLNAY